MAHVSRREFIRLVRQAYRQLPDFIRQRLNNVDIAVEERPAGDDQDLLPEDADLMGLYTGVPLMERAGELPPLPDRIVIYRQPILQRCATRTEVAREVRVTLWHEVGHYLGMSEEDLHRLGYG